MKTAMLIHGMEVELVPKVERRNICYWQSIQKLVWQTKVVFKARKSEARGRKRALGP